jgi:hypothetical protein
MARAPSPLLGYNTNVRHKGKLYHIQTEDSGVNHPHIITHLFADGGRIIASKKTDYAQHLGSENLAEVVKKLMQEQHKALFIALRDCVYDDDEADKKAEPGKKAEAAAPAPPPPPEPRPPEIDLDALERAAEAKIAESAAARAKVDPRRRGAGRYRQTAATHKKKDRVSQAPPDPQASIFNGQVLRSKSLDEVILSYLADDGEGE